MSFILEGGLRLLTSEVPEIFQGMGQGQEDWRGCSSSFGDGKGSGEGIVYCLLLVAAEIICRCIVVEMMIW